MSFKTLKPCTTHAHQPACRPHPTHTPPNAPSTFAYSYRAVCSQDPSSVQKSASAEMLETRGTGGACPGPPAHPAQCTVHFRLLLPSSLLAGSFVRTEISLRRDVGKLGALVGRVPEACFPIVVLSTESNMTDAAKKHRHERRG